MARTVDQIKQSIYTRIASRPSIAELITNPSTTALWKDFVECMAVEIATLEQLQDSYKADINTAIITAPIHNQEFVRNQAFLFQYDSVIPQVVELIDYVPTYNPVDATKRIITVCTVRLQASRVLDIKVAKNNPPEKLTVGELASIQGYYTDGGSSTALATGVGIAGIAHNLVTLDPDRVFIEGTIYHNGQFTSTIQADVILAIETYLYNLGRNGIIQTIKIIDAIQSVNGVTDVDIVNLAVRFAATAWGGKTYLIASSTVAYIFFETAAGYAYQENTAGETFTDKLTFTVG